jgi:choline transport protein
MSEETNDASKTIPLVVLWSVAGNAIMLLIVGITFIFCLGDLDSVLNSPTGQPMLQVFYNATQSVAGTSVMAAVVIVVLMSACVGQVATSSRQMVFCKRSRYELSSIPCRFSLANLTTHAGFPGSRFLGKVPAGWNVPINAIVVSAIVPSILSLINLGIYALPKEKVTGSSTDNQPQAPRPRLMPSTHSALSRSYSHMRSRSDASSGGDFAERLFQRAGGR